MRKQQKELEEIRVEETKPTKFNFDLAFQELLHSQLKIAAMHSLCKEPIGRFAALKQARIMIAPATDKQTRESHKFKQDEIATKVNEFQSLIYSYSLHFDEDYGNFVYPRPVEDVENKYPKGFNELRDEIDLMLDEWEEMLRVQMVKVGLFLVKDKTSYDALESD